MLFFVLSWLSGIGYQLLASSIRSVEENACGAFFYLCHSTQPITTHFVRW